MKSALSQTAELVEAKTAATELGRTGRMQAWFDNLERVPEGHATIFYIFISLILWAIVGFLGWVVWRLSS